jgi:serine/threonine protein kinase
MNHSPATPDAATWARLSPLLDAALDLPPPERTAWLATLQASAPEDVAALQALLERHEAAGRADFLKGSAHTVAPAPAAGHRLGSWTIEAPLGEGGMASVWLARRSDGRHDGRAAIKLMHGRLHGTQATQRFEREGRILARLEHPHIARLLDAGVASDGEGGQPYLVLELVRGQPIDRWCDERQLSVDARLALFADVLAAVAHAHTHGVIHRDLKPANILVDESGAVKLLDFGIAKLLDDEAAARDGSTPSAITHEGVRALTPEYASPEQLRGDGVTTATDVYALGVLLYQLLSGRHPTAHEGGSAADLMRSTLNTEPPRLSRAAALAPYDSRSHPASAAADGAAALRSTAAPRLRRALEGDLDNILARALRKAPAERYPTVVAFADDLRRHRHHEPVQARPDTLAYRSAKFVRRHRGAVAAGALVSLAVVAGVVGTATQARRAQEQAQRADREKQHALVDLGHAEALSTTLAVLLGTVADKSFTPAQLLQRAEAMTDTEYAAEAGTRAYLQTQLSKLWGELGNNERALDLARKAQASASAAADTPAATSANAPANASAQARQNAHLRNGADCMLGAMLVDRGDFAPAMTLFDEAIARARLQHPQEPDLVVGCLQKRAVLHYEQGRPQEALDDAQAALLALGAPRPGQMDMALMLRGIKADALSRLGRLGPAVQEYEAVLGEVKRLGRLEQAATKTTLNQYGLALMRGGQSRRAAEAFGQSVAMSLAQGDPTLVDIPAQTNLARSLVETGRGAQAGPHFQQALANAQRTGAPRMIASAAMNAGLGACDLGDLPRCAELLALGAGHLTALLPAGNPGLAAIHILRARLALAQGVSQEAAQQAQQALALYGDKPASAPLRAQALALLAQAQLRQGDATASLATANSAVQLARTAFQDFPANAPLGRALLALGQAQLAAGQADAARRSGQEAQVQLDTAAGPDAPLALQTRQWLATF